MIPQQNCIRIIRNDSAYSVGEESIHADAGACLDCSEERSADRQPTELDHDDADRRTLDEPQADEDEDNQH